MHISKPSSEEWVKMLTISLWSFTILQLCQASFLAPDEISEVEEGFVNGETEYILLDLRVTWNEAQIICESYKNGSLAIVDTDGTSLFLALALSETNFDMEDLWVGARRQPGVRDFTWINNRGSYIPDKNHHFISRGNESFSKNISRDCLSFSRKFHEQPFFVSLECDLQRACICEKPYERASNGSMTTPDWIVMGKYRYGIFYDRKTWKQSVRECRRKHKAHLASFRNKNEVDIVGKFELIGRPSLENAWIGGYFRDGHWRFISDDRPLPETSNNSFPPWRANAKRHHSGCLLLDRHLSNHPVFLEARCERRRSYICSKKIPYFPDFCVVIINNIGYIIYFIKKSWEDAQETCQSYNTSLVKVTQSNIHDVSYIMAENATEVHHIWIGGRLHDSGTYFYWVVDKELIPINNINISYYPPWFDNIYDPQYACLNMDRENHNRPIFYGAACDTPQCFICEQHNLTNLPKVRSGELMTSMTMPPE